MVLAAFRKHAKGAEEARKKKKAEAAEEERKRLERAKKKREEEAAETQGATVKELTDEEAEKIQKEIEEVMAALIAMFWVKNKPIRFFAGEKEVAEQTCRSFEGRGSERRGRR